MSISSMTEQDLAMFIHDNFGAARTAKLYKQLEKGNKQFRKVAGKSIISEESSDLDNSAVYDISDLCNKFAVTM
jgi:hypothetical protein